MMLKGIKFPSFALSHSTHQHLMKLSRSVSRYLIKNAWMYKQFNFIIKTIIISHLLLLFSIVVEFVSERRRKSMKKK